MSDDVKLPKILEFVKRVTLAKGRVRTTYRLFMINDEVFDTLCLSYLRGETSVVECREGVTIKSPKDKFDKTIARQEAMKKLVKQRYKILSLSASSPGKVSLVLETQTGDVIQLVKEDANIRIYQLDF